MILIGQYDSPFVRRVAIAMTIYGLSYEHYPWSTFSDADLLRPYNPLTRVPTLVLDDGDVLVDSHMILDYLDCLVGEDRAMFPNKEPERHRAMKVAALATGLADKAVSLFYEGRMHPQVSATWVARHIRQIEAVLQVLESDRAARTTRYWFGEAMSHADIAVTCALRFISDCHGKVVDLSRNPALKQHAQTMETMPVFQAISQVFIPPA